MGKPGFIAMGGVAVVLAAFSLSLLFQNLWIGFFAAFTVAVVWLFMLDRIMVTRLESQTSKLAIRVLIVLLVGFQLYASIRFYLHSDRQSETLTTIRTTIIESISQIEMERALQHTLRHYHMESERDQKTLEGSFRELFEDRLENDGTWIAETPNEDRDMNFTYNIASPDSIVLAVSANFTRGTDPEFLNFNQKAGMYQARTILTEGGVHYEREN